MNKILLGAILVFIISFSYSEANATTVSLGNLITGGVYTTSPNLITVDLSNECLTLIKQNDTSQCPTYQKILPFDNSNQLISGKFVNTNGFFHRLPTSTVNHWGMYPVTKWTVMIDADYRAIVHSKEITIVPSLTYINKDEVVNDNHSRNEYQNVYVYPSCIGAEIVYSNSILNETIKYLENGCTGTINDKVIKQTPASTKFDFNNPYSTLHYDSSLKSIFHGLSQLHNENIPSGGGLGPGNCINNKCMITTSSKKW